MKSYKKIGILGGMGPEATVALYRDIIRIFQDRYKAVYDSDFPEIIIVNLPLPDVVEEIEDSDKIKSMLLYGMKKLERSGVDFIAIPCNTVMRYMDDLQIELSVPILSIPKIVAESIDANKIKKVGLIGTEATMEGGVYQNALAGVTVLGLAMNEQAETTKIILNILSGKKSAEDGRTLEGFIKTLIDQGAEKVILGCTELPLLIEDDDRTIDTLKVLAEECVKRCF